MDLVKSSKKKLIIERIIILVLALGVIGLLVYFLSGTFFPFIKLEINRDFEGAKELLRSKGWIGFVTVSLIEALQMVVIFIPAEFIQLTSGMSYPWWQAIILCDIGVILGSSIIYLLVNIFKFDGDIFHRSSKIEKYARMTRTRSTIILMYVLFIMPIIPFGAICYYGSSKKIPYHKYVLTCTTGVIPSIATSILMGTAIKSFIANEIPIWLLILAIVLAAAILFVLLLFVLNKFFFKQSEYTPLSWLYGFMAKCVGLLLLFKVRYRISGKEKLNDLDGPYIMLCNHHTWFDFMGIWHINKDQRYAIVVNKYMFRLPIIGKWLAKAGCISKMMFYNDPHCIMDIIRAKKDGFPILMFPEARLSTDGGPSIMNPSVVRLVKKLDIPLVTVQLRKGYFIRPKWRNKMMRGPFEVEVKNVVSSDEINSLSDDKLLKLIEGDLYFNEFDLEGLSYKGSGKAKGLEHILYRCPHCGELYSNVSKGNTLTCTHCGTTYEIDNQYQFKEGKFKNIPEYYKAIKDIELKELDKLDLDIEVDTKIFDFKTRDPRLDKGVFHFDKNGVSYTSSENGLVFKYTIDELEAIAYSVNEEFEMYYRNELYYFYPSKDDKSICTRVALIYEAIKGAEYGRS